jgi:hypothetical protein|tara:strand:- start:1054 stop:1296 length:243 start_codon:yes stop_codon:yes gene_type:complete
MSEQRGNENEGFDYDKWRKINSFVDYLEKIHYMNRHKEVVDAMMHDLMIIDEVVDHMDDYPEAEYIINRINKRLDNDEKY